jgi:Flp pilus assembly protein TadD
MKQSLRVLLLSGFLASGIVCANSGPVSQSNEPEFIAGKQAIDAKEWKKAIAHFSRVKPDADASNYMGYASRNLGEYDAAFTHYRRALALDWYHRGAHEYIGEAYLLTNNLAKAEEHLGHLRKMCDASCEEYKDLERAVAEYKKKH